LSCHHLFCVLVFHLLLRWVLCILVTWSSLPRCAQMYDLKIIIFLTFQILHQFIGSKKLYITSYFFLQNFWLVKLSLHFASRPPKSNSFAKWLYMPISSIDIYFFCTFRSSKDNFRTFFKFFHFCTWSSFLFIPVTHATSFIFFFDSYFNLYLFYFY